MDIRECMSKNLGTVSTSATLKDAAKKMKDLNVGAIMVVEGMQLEGILTDRDLALAMATEGKTPQSSVREIMSEDPTTIDINDSLDEAFEIMSKETIRRLPVTENGKLVGVLSSSDLAAVLKKEVDQFLDLEEAYSKAVS